VFLFSMPIRYFGIDGSSSLMSNAAHRYGVAIIDVFNNQDLLMMENWFTLTDATSNQLLPIFASDGSRLEYHKSDRIYFGHTLNFRRAEINQSDCALIRHEKKIGYLTEVWMFKSGLTGSHEFIYTQYYQKAPEASLLEMNIYKPNPIEVRCTVNYTDTR
ncbi:MAG: hypothetical protein NT020_08630, partial [Chloroflexales bacterium]|nr:hypothetical protein [Chloroflexales bacterium]